jgi:hypothetical protein
MSFNLRTDVPMPGARNRYPFDTMPAGASFEIHGEEEARKVRNAAYQYAKKVNLQKARAQAAADLGRDLTAEERAAVEPLEKGQPGAVDFALRKLRVEGETVGEDGKPTGGVPVYGLWRVA